MRLRSFKSRFAFPNRMTPSDEPVMSGMLERLVEIYPGKIPVAIIPRCVSPRAAGIAVRYIQSNYGATCAPDGSLMFASMARHEVDELAASGFVSGMSVDGRKLMDHVGAYRAMRAIQSYRS